MPLEMMDADRRNAKRQGERVGKGRADQQRAGKPRPLGIADAGQFVEFLLCKIKNLSRERRKAPHMVTRGQLRHDAAVGLVHVGLGVHQMRKQAPGLVVIQSHPCLVAGGLDTQDEHSPILIQFRPFSGPGFMPTVRVKENEPFEVAMRRFKRTVEKTGLLTELRAREYYEKPTAERKRKLAAAVKRHHKRLRSQMLPQKMY